MLNRREHTAEAIAGEGQVRRYAAAHRKQAGPMYDAFLADMRSLRPVGECLEVGAGTGSLTCLMAREHPGLAITAFDSSPPMVDLARKYVRDRGLDGRVRFLCADVNDDREMGRLGTFDLICSAYSLHHWREPRRALSNLWTALKDGGMLYILDLRRVWWLYLVPGNGGFLSSVRASYRPDEIEQIFDALGITRYRIRTSFPGFIQSITAWK
jgi:SAM-dependent methyltransferase